MSKQTSTYPIRAVSRMTGLSEQLIRTWESRYAAVRPERTASGARRYTAPQVRRLRLLARGKQAGFRIGELAGLDERELERRLAALDELPASGVEPILAASERLDAPAVEHLLALRLAALGPREFARRVAQPLLVEVGRRWQGGTLCVAAEHLISGALVGLLRSALAVGGAAAPGSRTRVVFAGLSGVRHELGLLIACVCAQRAGMLPIYLGADLPAAEIAHAVREAGARAAVVAAQMLAARDLAAQLAALRALLDPSVRIWVGGARPGARVARSQALLLDSLEAFEAELELLEIDGGTR